MGGRLAVVAGVIYNPGRDRILIARRPDHLHLGGLWEFPGGKLQAGESPRAALTRELWEELAITVIDCAPLMTISHDYADKTVSLEVWEVGEFRGVAVGNEGQQTAWVALADLHRYEFPAANQPVVKRLVGA